MSTQKISSLVALVTLLGFTSVWIAAPAAARVLGVEIERRTPVLDGRAFGDRGGYEMLEGRIELGFDPANEANARVTDIGLAPREADGLVHASTPFVVLQAIDPAMRRGTALVEAVNRGRRLALGTLNRAAVDFLREATLDPDRPDDFGDGLVMELGLTIVWIGWQHDAPGVPGSLRIEVPRARNADGSPLRGLARSDWVVEKPTTHLALATLGHAPHLAAEPDAAENVLTVRPTRGSPRAVVPRGDWRFDDAGSGVILEGGFLPGQIYELVYVAHDPPLAGLGFAAFRDIATYLRTDPEAAFPAERAIAIGSSQSGRFLRHFLYDGFNVDESGHEAYQGVLINIAGAGRGGFNHRFSHPGRVGNPFRNFFYPGDDFPFASQPTTDSRTGLHAGLFDRTRAHDAMPRVFQVNTGYEYWGRLAALVHMDTQGEFDLEPLERERVYHVASAPHYPMPFPPRPESEVAPGVYRGSPLETSSIGRALLVHMLAWVEEDVAPPPSQIPRIDQASLVAPTAVRNPVPGLETPKAPHTAWALDFGSRFRRTGIVDRQPPALGPRYPVRVPQLDPLGIEVAGIRTVALRAPIGSYLPWALRTGYPVAQNQMADYLGTFAPFSRTDAERAARADSRPSLLALYPTRADYDLAVEQAIDAMVAEGFMLERDRQRERALAGERWDWTQTRTP